MTAEEALRATPVEVKVFDRYLTVARVVSSKSIQEEEVMSSPPSEQPVPMPNRLCSMRVILLLEDMGPTGDPQDEVSGISRQTAAGMQARIYSFLVWTCDTTVLLFFRFCARSCFTSGYVRVGLCGGSLCYIDRCDTGKGRRQCQCETRRDEMAFTERGLLIFVN